MIVWPPFTTAIDAPADGPLRTASFMIPSICAARPAFDWDVAASRKMAISDGIARSYFHRALHCALMSVLAVDRRAWRALFAAQLGWMLDAMDFLLFSFAVIP